MKSQKEKNTFIRRRSLLFLAGLVFAVLLSGGCGRKDSRITSIEQLKEPGRVITVCDGTPEEDYVRRDFPNAKIQPFQDMIAAYTAVKNGKADACIHSRNEMQTAIKNGFGGVHLLEETYCQNTIAVGISKLSPIPDLKEKIDSFLKGLSEKGILNDMYDRWVNKAEETMPEIPKPENPKGTLRVGTTGTIMPYSYYIGERLAGYDIELATRFAAWMGMNLEFKIYSFAGIISAAQTNEIDCIMSNFYYTEEHEEAITFSRPVFYETVTVMVRDADSAGAGGSFWSSVAASFEKTFIRESRWKLLLQGTGTTLLITVLSIFLGTLLGFFVYMLCRTGNPFTNTLTRFFVWLIQGMPVVVFLMILYYIIFGNVNISGTIVSVIGFTLIFGASVFSMLKTGIGALSEGQKEAAYSLGFSDRKTFYLIMLPQAIPHITAPFTEQITQLIKVTAIVGYIAVQDLTKMGDIIRNRTYEAFFPLVTVAIIYFLIAWIMTFLARRIGSRIDTRKRKRKALLKGVKLHD